MSGPPKRLYHYTGSEGLIGILTGLIRDYLAKEEGAAILTEKQTPASTLQRSPDCLHVLGDTPNMIPMIKCPICGMGQ